MNTTLFEFELNLSLCLAHTVLLEAKQQVPVGVVDDFVNGDPPAPSVNQSVGDAYNALVKNLPRILDITRENIGPFSQASNEAYLQTAPQQAELQRNLANLSQLSQAQTDLTAVQQYGPQFAASSLAADKLANPEFYSTREATSKAIADQLSGKLSGGELASIERGNLFQNSQAGTLATSNPLTTAENLSQYGFAAQDKITKAIQEATSFLPASKNNFDVFQQATGRSGTQTGVPQFDLNNNTSQYGQLAGTGIETAVGASLQKNQINADRRSTAEVVAGSLPDYSG